MIAAILWVTGSITLLAVLWAIYSNKQMEVMQEQLWDLQEENSKLKKQNISKEAGDEVLKIQVNQEVEERLRNERNLFKTVG